MLNKFSPYWAAAIKEEIRMKTKVKKMLVMGIVFSMLCASVALSTSKQVSAKAYSKITKTITLRKKNAIHHKLSIAKNEKVYVKVKILSIKGKAKLDINGDLLFGDFEGSTGKGTLFNSYEKPKLKISAFKKGKVLQMSKWGYLAENVDVGWWVPDGIKNMKIRITYYTKSGKAGIKSLKQKEQTW